MVHVKGLTWTSALNWVRISGRGPGFISNTICLGVAKAVVDNLANGFHSCNWKKEWASFEWSKSLRVFGQLKCMYMWGVPGWLNRLSGRLLI